MSFYNSCDITKMLDTVCRKIENNGDQLIFHTNIGKFTMEHVQDCCESVHIEDIIGDLDDLIGYPILEAEEVINPDDSPDVSGYSPESYTWTFYKLRTHKGGVTIRWFGESNGYYSERVDLSFEPQEDPQAQLA